MEESDEENILHTTNLKATRELVAEQDKEYRESLLADQHKEERKEKIAVRNSWGRAARTDATNKT